jgi:hypothetical protein
VSALERRLLSATILMLVCATTAFADVVVKKDSTVFGKITKITKAAVTIKPECSSTPEAIPTAQVREVVFDSDCKLHTITLPQTAVLDCGEDARQLYQVEFAGLSEATYAEEATLNEEGDVKLKLPEKWGQLSGSVEKVKSIKLMRVCAVDYMALTNKFTSPSSFIFAGVK